MICKMSILVCAPVSLLLLLLLVSLEFVHVRSAPAANGDEDFHFEDEPNMEVEVEGKTLDQVARDHFPSESEFSQWPRSWSPLSPVRILGIGLLLGACVTYSLFCCVKKRSGSYGERNVPTLKIYKLKSEKSGASEIPEPDKLANDSQALRYSPTPATVVQDPPKLIRIHEGTIKTDPVRKVVLKESVSPPTPIPGAKFGFPFSNPDPTKEPLKPFTYSPIPPKRPDRSRSNVGTGANTNGKSKKSGLPFSNPDPLTEPLKPFTYSPIPARPQSD